MANHIYTRAGGVWSPLTDILAAELADLDAKTVDSMSGTGGTYSLTENMTVGGAPGIYWHFTTQVTFADKVFGFGGIEAYGPMYLGGSDFLLVDKDVRFFQNATFEDETSFSAAAFFNNDVQIGDSSGDALWVNAEADFYAPVDFWGAASLHGYTTIGDLGGSDFLIVNATGTYNGQQTFAAPVTFTGGAAFNTTPATFSATATFFNVWGSGSGGAQVKRFVDAPDANATFSPRSCDVLMLPAGSPAASRTYTIDDTGASDGMEMLIVARTGIQPMVIKEPGGSVLESSMSTNTGQVLQMRVRRQGGSWEAFGKVFRP